MNILKLLGSYIASFSPVMINNLLKIESTGQWYQSLEKPFFTPPGWVFAPVWTTIYILMGISLFLFLQAKGTLPEKRLGLIFFTIQIILNASYTPIFFGQESLLGGLIISTLLAFFVILTILEFLKFSKVAACLLIPYILWGIFAIILGSNILLIN